MSAEHLELPITGMTCAACANRIERRSTGSTASPPPSTTRPSGRPSTTTRAVVPEQLVGAVEAAGYGAELPTTEPEPDAARGDERAAAPPAARLRAAAAAGARARDERRRCSSTTGSGWRSPGHAGRRCGARCRSTARRGRTCSHGTATMDTLISVGVLAAFGVVAVRAVPRRRGRARACGCAFDLIPERGEGTDEIYLEVAGRRDGFLLAGRYIEARAKRRAGAALTALLELGAKDVAMLDDDGAERRVPVERARASATASSCAPGRRSPPTAIVEEGTSAVDRRCSPASRCRSRRPGRRGRRRDGERRRAPRGARDAGRRRHRAGADRPAGRGGADRQGAGPAARRPGLRRVRPGRHRARRATLGFWLGAGESADVRVHRGRRRGDHRLPVRARAWPRRRRCSWAPGRGAQLGLLIRGPEVLESTRAVDTIVLDKTGTVTTGRMSLVDVAVADGAAGGGAAARRRAGGRLRAPDRPGDRPGGRA